ncbi:vacuolar membrane-associated protein Iml1p [[Candida] anglica]|uniref:Vacuolar membrane-associated protein IML1 n=1 Tax=[Candida] anglica TaxID=148631 RepID=A0ABP0EBP6_9ASCO
MQHSRMYNPGGGKRDGDNRARNVSMSANQASLIVGGGSSSHSSMRSTSSIGNTLTIGRRDPSRPHNVSSNGKVIRHNLITSFGNSVGGTGSSSASLSTIPGSSDIIQDQYTTPSNRLTEPVPITVWFHEVRTSSEDVVLDAATVPGVREGDICELTSSFHEQKKRFVFKVSSGNSSNVSPGSATQNNMGNSVPTPIPTSSNPVAPLSMNINNNNNNNATTPKGNYQISLLSNPLQKLMDLPPRSQAVLRVVPLQSVEADTVEIFIKDISLSRDSMWSFSSTLVGTCVYAQKRLTYLNGRCGTVKNIYKDGKSIFSGYIGQSTIVNFRSESSRLVFLVHLAREMWHFEENGEIMFHKLVNTLFPKIFQKWRDNGAHHSITIVLFTSVDLTTVPWTSLGQGEKPSNRRDFFRVAVDQIDIFHWDRIMANLRLEFANFKRDIMLHQEKNSEGYIIQGESLPSVKGNILEAVNLAITLVCDRFRNADLKHSLNHFVLVTSGTGLFDVDYNLMVETSRKMTSIDVALDIVCLSQPPLHIVPLFRYKDPTNGGKIAHCVPNWCDISFFKDSGFKSSQWIPRCKIYELQMMGVMENEINELEIERLYLKNAKSALEAMEMYDEEVFQPVDIKSSRVGSIGQLQKRDGGKEVKELPSTPNEATTPNNMSLSLMWNSKKPLSSAKVVDVLTTNSLALGTTNTGSDVSALTTLYTLNKNSDVTNNGNSNLNLLAPRAIRSESSTPNSSRSHTPIPIKSSRMFTQPRMIGELELSRSPKRDMRDIQREMLDKRDVPRDNDKNSRDVPLDRSSNSGSMSGRHLSNTDDRPKLSHTNSLWTNVPNPSKEMHTDVLEFLRLSRWNGVFPPKIKRKQVKWRSFQSPAALPLVTKNFPSVRELESEYTFQLYDVLLSPDNDLHLASTKDLMREMIQLRLLLGFQICFGDEVKRVEASWQSGGSPENLIKYFPQTGDCLGAIVYMSLDDEIHRIMCDYNGNLSVQLYRHNKAMKEVPTALGARNYKLNPYLPLIRTRYADEYSPAKIDAINTKPKKYNWNQFDQLLAGLDDIMPDDQKDFHKMKFVVMPIATPKNAFYISNERLSDEEIRVEGIRKLIAMIERGKCGSVGSVPSSAGSRKKEVILPEISFYTGNLYEFLCESENFDKSKEGLLSDREQFNKSIKLVHLAQELQSSNGLTLADRTWHFKTHHHCFLGNELVSWLIENFEDIDSREDAAAFGQQLMDNGLFKHVESRHGLLDGYYFYEFSSEYIDKTSNQSQQQQSQSLNGWFKRNKSVTQESTTPTTSDSESLATSQDAATVNKASSTTPPKKKKFFLSNQVSYNVDPLKKSFKPEIITVHYDKVHNPDHCYHIRFQWLNTTAKFIDETITSWARFCERHGLKLVETPWNELCEIPRTNPFHSFVDLKLVLNPWTDPEFKDSPKLVDNKFYFHLYLLRKSGFFLDNRSANFFSKDDIEISYSWGKPIFKYAQYIHRTGMYIVELRDSGNMFLAPNNVHLVRSSISLAMMSDHDKTQLQTSGSQQVMLNFRSICTSEKRLREIFVEAKHASERG